jgi:hypothetical protein
MRAIGAFRQRGDVDIGLARLGPAIDEIRRVADERDLGAVGGDAGAAGRPVGRSVSVPDPVTLCTDPVTVPVASRVNRPLSRHSRDKVNRAKASLVRHRKAG